MGEAELPDIEKARFLEALAVSAWPPAAQEPLEGWQLGFDRGATRRANSTLPNRLAPGADAEALIAEVERRYRDRGLAPCFKISPAATPADLDRRLAARGYDAEGQSLVLTAGSAIAAGAEAAPGVDLQLLDAPTPAWCAACWPGAETAEAEARAAIARRIEAPRAFALAAIEGKTAGAAAIACRDGWACITAVNTLGAWRRRGVAWTLMAGLTEWAMRQAPEGLYLQVEADNTAARALYDRLGFKLAYPYHYRRQA
ncbi:MAG: GNAT family N-acetyltransferase [Kiloniellales bacterium]|nr:GNAT family N-acetyltransferase [Kiloniellales bacterium]